MLTKKEKQFLLKIARCSIKKKHFPPSEIPVELKKKAGVFVTLTLHQKLKGCIGHIEPIMPIYKGVKKCAYSAAYQDPRFFPVQKQQIKSLKIEISILTKPKRLDYSSAEELLKQLNHNLGVIIKKGTHSSTFLPQVWKKLPDKTDFMNQLSLKAGLNPDAWKNNDLQLYVYKIENFREK